MKETEAEPLWGEDPEELWDLYRRSSMLTGRDSKREEDETPEKPPKKAAGGGVQKAYSLWWLFAAHALPTPEDAPLVHAFLGDETARRSLRAAYEKSERVHCDHKDYIDRAPNERQWEAIETALQSPISFIQGPPGTGKTATIINLVYQIAKLGKTAAIVSSNNSALENIHTKLNELQAPEKAGSETQTQRDEVKAPALCVAKLGKADNRKTFYKGREAVFPDRHAERYYYFQEKKGAPVRKEETEKWLNTQEPHLWKAMRRRLKDDPLDEAAGGWLAEMEASKAEGGKGRQGLLEQGWSMTHPDGTLQSVTRECGVTAKKFFDVDAGFAAFTSTVHSLPNCFEDGLFYQYDYVIVDESSQMGLSAGLLVMCHAKHLVLVGDEQQLAPVVDERALALLDEEDEEDKEERMDPEDQAVCDAIAYESDPDSYDEYDEEEWRQWEEEDRLNQEWYDIARWGNYRPRPEVSFLDLCLDVFLGRKDGSERKGGLLQGLEPYPKVFLNQHYRCHPGIIEFCNETVYTPAGTPLECCTIRYDENIQIPIRVLQFEGDYCESCYASASKEKEEPDKKEPGGEETPEEARWKALEATWAAEGQPIPPLSRPGRPSKRNLRQVEIFMEVEWPKLLERLEGEERFSVCVLSPFRGQLRALEEAIKCYGCDIAEGEEKSEKEKKDVTVLSLSIDNASGKKDKDEKKSASALTIHKSQGQEFDVVYLMPVEDGAWEWPFSQKKRMVNVAVSRAKKELRVITSQKYMNQELETQDVQKAKDEMYLKKLVEYVEQNATGEDADKGFGVQSSVMASLFDAKKPRPMNVSEEEEKAWVSAGQKLVETALAEMAPRLGFSWTGEDGVDREVPVKRVLEELAGSGFRSDPRYEAFMAYINNEKTTFDCVIRDPDGKSVLAIEVDGAYHRYPWRDKEKDKDTSPDALYLRWRDRWRKDRVKDQIVKLAGGTVYYGNRKDLVGMVGKERQVIHQWDREDPGTFALLRLSDDGTTFLETDALRAGAPKELADKVFTIQDLVCRYLTQSLSHVWKVWPEEEREWLAAHLPGTGKLTASRVQPRLEELGLLEHTDAGWQVTADGYALGIRMYDDREKQATYPIYPPCAKRAIRRLLLEGMK